MNNARCVALAVVFAVDPHVSQRVKNALHPEAQVRVIQNEHDCLHSVDRVRGALIFLELSPQTDMPVRRILWALRGRDPSRIWLSRTEAGIRARHDGSRATRSRWIDLSWAG